MTRRAVVIVGGGPTGLTLAAELALAKVDVAVVERRATQEIAGSRAGGLHSRTLELLDQRGIADRFISEGQKAQVAGFAGVSFDISGFPTRHDYGLGLWQSHIERILAGWVSELPVTFFRGRDVTGLVQREDGVELLLGDGSRLHADYVVGCDGGRSAIRKAAGIEFPGSDPTMSNLIAEVELAKPPADWGIRRDARGVHGLSRVQYEIRDGRILYADHGPVRVMITETKVATAEPTLQELRDAMIDVFGTDYGVHSPIFISRFTDAARQAAKYRERRVLLAGDAAHVHPPDGGQGLNMGVHDAMNLGWKLAQVVQGVSPDSLLDTYHAERHPVGVELLRNTMASALLRRTDERTNAVRAVLAELLAFDEPRKHVAAMMSGLHVRYGMNHPDILAAHPLLGRRMPDLGVETADGPLRIHSLLHAARPAFVNLSERGDFDISPWQDRVPRVDARCAGSWALPAVGNVPAPDAVLIRPDGHVAWVSDATSSASLADALTAWFGRPRP